MVSRNTAKQSAIRRKSRRTVCTGATASALAVVLASAVATPAMAVPGEARKVHVEGQLIPVEQGHDVYRMTGGFVGTYKLRSELVSYAWTYWDTEIREIRGTASMMAVSTSTRIRAAIRQSRRVIWSSPPTGWPASTPRPTGCSMASLLISSAAVGASVVAY